MDEEASGHAAADSAADLFVDPWALLQPIRGADGGLLDVVCLESNKAAQAEGFTSKRPVASLLPGVPAGSDSDYLLHVYADVAATGNPLIADELARYDAAGAEIGHYDVRASRVGDSISVTWRDVTSRVARRREMREVRELYQRAMADSAIGLCLIDPDGRFLVTNPALTRFLGREDADLHQCSWQELTNPDDLSADLEQVSRMLAGEIDRYRMTKRYLRPDGTQVVGDLSVSAVRDPDGTLRYFVSQIVDVTEEHRQREQLEYQAWHDPRTGLRNRAWLTEVLDSDLADAHRRGGAVAALFIDVDHFKYVNDSLGHAAGDQLLREVAARLSAATESTGCRAAHFGGDEFVVVLPDVVDAGGAERIAEDLAAQIRPDLFLEDGHRLRPTVSIGIAVSRPGTTSSDLLRDADTAMFRAKGAGRDQWQFFDPQMHESAVRRLTLEQEIRDGLGRGEFVAFYQPIVELASGDVSGHEALVRWRHPSRGLLTPAEFLGVAEDSDLIVHLDLLLLDQVCTLIKSRPDLPGPISVNVSPAHLARRALVPAVRDAMAAHAIPPGRLIVEITETAVLDLTESALADLARLRDAGVGVHVDDFGSGYSSISLLRTLPVTGLKLDSQFVAALSPEDGFGLALTEGLAHLLLGLRLDGIAEGVETEAQAGILKAQGWQHAQGYLFGRPVPPEQIRVLSAGRHRE